jgi:dipeptidyl aminopeptidase/acylaminoacyl peptidase
MKPLTLCAIILMTTSTLAQTAAITDPKQLQSKQIENMQSFSIERLYMTRNIGSSAWSPDGKQIAFVSNISGRNNLWLVPSTGGWPQQLTVSNQRQIEPVWSPDGKWIAYATDYDGDEMWDIHLVSPLTGEDLNLTTSREIAEDSPAWSPDSRFLAYQVKPKTSSTTEIDILEIETRKTRHVTTNTPKELSNFNPRWSRDGKFLAYTQAHATGKDSSVFIYDLATNQHTNLTPHQREHTHSVADWSPDSKTLLIESNSANGYDNVALLDIATKKLVWLTKEKWEVSAGNFSPDGRFITYEMNVDGERDIYFHDLATNRADRQPLPKGVNYLAGAESSFTRDGHRLLYIHEGPNAPKDLWALDLASKKSTQVTNSLMAGIRPQDMVEPYLVHYPSRDGKFTISAWTYVPNNIPRNGKFPAIVYIHGGPSSQSMNNFNRWVQYILNQGYLVIAPNYRGSTGYGKEFNDANRGDAGGGELHDVIDAGEWIAKSGFVDPRKLIVMGGSYGGYLSMMSVTKFPDMWAAGVPIVPFVNWFTEIENEDPALREYDLATMGDPVKNKALYQDRSPIFFVDRIKAPLLLLAGGNDPRCPKSEAQQVVDAVKKRGGVAKLKIYEDEGHSFSRIENQIDAYQRVSDFVKTYVPSPGCGTGPCTTTE